MSVASANARNSESLISLRAVFDDCLLKLDSAYGEFDRSKLLETQQLIASRIIDLAEQGVTDPELLEKEALAGLLPDNLY